MNVSRIASLALAVALIIVAGFRTEEPEPVFRCCIAMILPLACIWFSEAMGMHVNPVWGIDRPTPGVAIAVGGWLLMLAYSYVVILAPVEAIFWRRH